MLRLIRAFVAVLGVIAVVIGILYAARTLHLIYSALSNPESLRSILDRWASAVGGKELDVVIAGTRTAPQGLSPSSSSAPGPSFSHGCRWA